MKKVILSFTSCENRTYLNIKHSHNLKKSVLAEFNIANLDVDIFLKSHYIKNPFKFLNIVQSSSEDFLFAINYKNKKNLLKRCEKILKYSSKKSKVKKIVFINNEVIINTSSFRPHNVKIREYNISGVIPWLNIEPAVDKTNELNLNHNNVIILDSRIEKTVEIHNSSINIGSNFKGTKEQRDLLLKIKEGKSKYASLNKHNYAKEGV